MTTALAATVTRLRELLARATPGPWGNSMKVRSNGLSSFPCFTCSGIQ